ncbi:hypothetical protein ERJ70_09505 [Sediminibacillus dalangtanensis]|uniref:DUF4031 domain-containing protein n=1 Tax=Sediminibacillus dalangtanensis TaxID=2729421 RepID=A0ABX7VRG4_9BACI|nr:hypothetical protein [Sediminibacillus dalangtanensis]QTM99517.1 hypothetical protein ERJ70_09505 [Sediminibacillus dalangtanensis]
MAFGLKREELNQWKKDVEKGNIAFLTHFWLDSRFPGCDTVTKAGCSDVNKLIKWGKQYGLDPHWIHRDDKYPHYDLFGERQKQILTAEKQWSQLEKFHI